MQAYRVLPLALLYASGGQIKGRTRFQKLAFLADQRLEEHNINPYDFVPYKYGPFDSKLYDALEWLEMNGLVDHTKRQSLGGDTRHDYRLTSRGRNTFEKNVPSIEGQNTLGTPTSAQQNLETLLEVARKVVDEFGDVPVSNLIKYVYDEYPDYAENSVLY